MHPKNHHNVAVILLLGIILLFVLLIFSFYKGEKQKSTNITELSTSDYISTNMNFLISYPVFFELNDNGTLVILTNDEGVIEIIRNGTDGESLTEYLNTFDSRRNIEISSQNTTTINNEDVIVREEFFPNSNKEQKAFYISANNAIYILSTTSPELYDELDQVAQSFRYIGE